MQLVHQDHLGQMHHGVEDRALGVPKVCQDLAEHKDQQALEDSLVNGASQGLLEGMGE